MLSSRRYHGKRQQLRERKRKRQGQSRPAHTRRLDTWWQYADSGELRIDVIAVPRCGDTSVTSSHQLRNGMAKPNYRPEGIMKRRLPSQGKRNVTERLPLSTTGCPPLMVKKLEKSCREGAKISHGLPPKVTTRYVLTSALLH